MKILKIITYFLIGSTIAINTTYAQSQIKRSFKDVKSKKYNSPKLLDLNCLIKDVRGVDGLKKDIDKATSDSIIVDYNYIFIVDKYGKIHPHVYLVKSEHYFTAIRNFIDNKFNHYKWLPASKNKTRYVSYLQLNISSDSPSDTLNISITQTIATQKLKFLKHKTLYKFSILYNDLK